MILIAVDEELLLGDRDEDREHIYRLSAILVLEYVPLDRSVLLLFADFVQFYLCEGQTGVQDEKLKQVIHSLVFLPA